MLSKKSMSNELLDEFWGQKKALKPSVVVKVLFSQDVLTVLRRELNRQADARLDMEDVFESLKAIVTKESLMDAGEIGLSKKKRRKRKQKSVAALPTQQATNPSVSPSSPTNEAVIVEDTKKSA